MNLREEIENRLKDAIREKNDSKRNAIRLLLTALKMKEKELKRLPGDMEIRQVISNQIKQRKDSAEQYRNARREDLAAQEEEEIRILQAFLPEALPLEALEELVEEVIAETGAESARDMGKVMKAIMPRVSGRADGKTVNELVRRRLQP